MCCLSSGVKELKSCRKVFPKSSKVLQHVPFWGMVFLLLGLSCTTSKSYSALLHGICSKNTYCAKTRESAFQHSLYKLWAHQEFASICKCRSSSVFKHDSSNAQGGQKGVHRPQFWSMQVLYECMEDGPNPHMLHPSQSTNAPREKKKTILKDKPGAFLFFGVLTNRQESLRCMLQSWLQAAKHAGGNDHSSMPQDSCHIMPAILCTKYLFVFSLIFQHVFHGKIERHPLKRFIGSCLGRIQHDRESLCARERCDLWQCDGLHALQANVG